MINWTLFASGLITSFLGSLGFALIFRLRPRYLTPAAFGGLFAFAVYFICDAFGMGLFASNFFAAIVGALYSELLARMMKAPTVEFSIPCIIPLVPGSMLYYSMSHLLAGNYEQSFASLRDTLMTALGIAAGMIVVSILSGIFFHFAKKKA